MRENHYMTGSAEQPVVPDHDELIATLFSAAYSDAYDSFIPEAGKDYTPLQCAQIRARDTADFAAIVCTAQMKDLFSPNTKQTLNQQLLASQVVINLIKKPKA